MGPTLLLASLLSLVGCAGAPDPPDVTEVAEGHEFEVTKSEAEWREQLSDEEFHILRESGTERAFTGRYWDNKKHGVYLCAGCGNPLFHSEHKFRSGTGWPSYTQPITSDAVATRPDRKFGMARTEVICARCGGHLGHVFSDGPEPTGLRYCMNGNAMDFEQTPEERTPAEDAAKFEPSSDAGS